MSRFSSGLKFDLIVDGMCYYSTSSNKEFLEEMVLNFKKLGDTRTWEIRDYMVVITMIQSATEIAWKKGKGFSLWSDRKEAK